MIYVWPSCPNAIFWFSHLINKNDINVCIRNVCKWFVSILPNPSNWICFGSIGIEVSNFDPTSDESVESRFSVSFLKIFPSSADDFCEFHMINEDVLTICVERYSFFYIYYVPKSYFAWPQLMAVVCVAWVAYVINASNVNLHEYAHANLLV